MRKAMFAVPLGISACGIPYDGRELNDDEHAKVALLGQQEPEDRELVEAVVRIAPEGTVFAGTDAKGEDTERLVDDLAMTGNDLAWYIANDRVFAYSGARAQEGEEYAAHLNYNPLTVDELGDDYLMLNADYVEDWNVGVLVHETKHRVSGTHNSKIVKAMAEKGERDGAIRIDAEFAKIVQTYQDAPYQDDEFYAIPQFLRARLDGAREAALASDAPEVALAMPDKETFVTEQAQWLFTQTDFLTAYGIDEAMLAEAIGESEWYEREAELRAELQRELAGEVRKEIRPEGRLR